MEAMTFAPADALAAAEQVGLASKTGGVAEEKLLQWLDWLKFRDPAGTWWSPGVSSARWYRTVQGRWIAGGKPRGRLVGPASVHDLLDFAIGSPVEDTSELEADESVGRAAEDEMSTSERVEAAEGLVRRLNRLFETGQLDSEAIERCASGLALVDREGGLWTVGLTSGCWYRLGEREWVVQPAPPEELPTSSELAGLAPLVLKAQLPLLLDRAPAVPEPILGRWDPPAGAPEIPELPPGPISEPEPRAAPTMPDVTATARSPSEPAAVVRAPAVRETRGSEQARPKRGRGRRRTLLLVVLVALIAGGVVLVSWLQDQVFVSPEQMYFRGQNCRDGIYSPRNYERALYWYRRAADEGHVPSMLELAEMYEAGEGVPVDRAEAERWRLRAAGSGDPPDGSGRARD